MAKVARRPVMRKVRNPFTGELVERASYDPDPMQKKDSTYAPLAPPFPFVLAPISRQWWDNLLDLYLLLVPDDREARDVRADDSLSIQEMTDRIFAPLFAGRGDQSNVYATPPALARLSDEDADDVAAKLAHDIFPDATRPNPFTGVAQDYSTYRERLEREARESLRESRALARLLLPPEALWFWGWFE